METVDQFLARGGQIKTVPAGRRGAKKAPQFWVVWDDLVQALAIQGKFADRDAAHMAAADAVGDGGHPVVTRYRTYHGPLPVINGDATRDALS